MKYSLAIVIFLSLVTSSVAHAVSSSPVLITGVYYDPFVNGEASEAVQLQNISASTVSIANWTLTDGEGSVVFPADANLNPKKKVWVTKSALAFESEFGFAPAYEYGGDSDTSVPDMSGSAPSLANAGDQVLLEDNANEVIDAMVYGDATLGQSDWTGSAVQPYKIGGNSSEGQILTRKMSENDGMPVPDSNTRADWSQDAADAYLGKRVVYPGWKIDEFFQTRKANENATIKYCVAPDQLFTCIRDEIIFATSTISIEMYSMDNANVVDVLTRTLDSGVRVSILLDGSALGDQGRWACEQIEMHYGECWFMASKPQANIHKRYDNQHGKWLIVDRTRVLIGTENLDDDGLPADDKSDGTLGTRGGFLITDSPTIVADAQEIQDRDFDPAHHSDIRRWGTNTDDFPPLNFMPSYVDGGKTYRLQFPTPFVTSGTIPIELVQCPENCLRSSNALLGMISSAHTGDTLLTEQQYEYTFWGSGASNALTDPNLRLEAYLAAAKRGAHVRILLDSYYDAFSDPRSNYSTCAYVNQFAPQYDIECRIGNPTGRGIHSKVVLLQHSATGFVHLGSMNGSETSSKLNREVATQVESLSAYRYWAKVFDYDWSTTNFAPHRQFLPLLEFRWHP